MENVLCYNIYKWAIPASRGLIRVTLETSKMEKVGIR